MMGPYISSRYWFHFFFFIFFLLSLQRILDPKYTYTTQNVFDQFTKTDKMKFDPKDRVFLKFNLNS